MSCCVLGKPPCKNCPAHRPVLLDTTNIDTYTKQYDDCPIRAFHEFQEEQARAERQATATALAYKRVVREKKQTVLICLQLVLLVCAAFALFVFLFQFLKPTP